MTQLNEMPSAAPDFPQIRPDLLDRLSQRAAQLARPSAQPDAKAPPQSVWVWSKKAPAKER